MFASNGNNLYYDAYFQFLDESFWIRTKKVFVSYLGIGAIDESSLERIFKEFGKVQIVECIKVPSLSFIYINSNSSFIHFSICALL